MIIALCGLALKSPDPVPILLCDSASPSSSFLLCKMGMKAAPGGLAMVISGVLCAKHSACAWQLSCWVSGNVYPEGTGHIRSCWGPAPHSALAWLQLPHHLPHGPHPCSGSTRLLLASPS
jgi:hypothetical protein